MDDVTSADLPPDPTTNPQLLPNLIQAGLMPNQIAGYMRHLRRRHAANVNAVRRRVSMDKHSRCLRICPTVYPTIDLSVIPPRGRLILRQPNGRRHKQRLPSRVTTMNRQLLNDSDEAINVTQGLSIPEQIAAMNAAL